MKGITEKSKEVDSSWSKFNKIKIKEGVSIFDFRIYFNELKKAYNDKVKEYMKDFGNLTIATNLAVSDFSQDIQALKSGYILLDSKVPGFRRY